MLNTQTQDNIPNLTVNKESYQRNAEKDRKRFINLFAVVCFSGLVLSVIPDIYFGSWYTVGTTLLFGLPLVFIPILNKRFPSYISANILLFFLSCLAFVFSALLGKISNLHLYFFFVLVVVPFVIDGKQIYLILLHITHPILLFAVLYLNNFQISFIPPYNLFTNEQLEIFGFVNLVILFLLAPLVIYVIIEMNKRSAKELQEIARTLDLRNQELTQANIELDRFAGTVSHDLRSPIHSLIGLTKLFKDETDLNLVHDYAVLQEKTLRKLEGFINELLEHSRNVRTPLKREKVDFKAFIEELLVQHQHNSTELKMEVVIEQETVFFSDLSRLQTIFGNLIANTFRYADTDKAESFLKIEGKVDTKKAVISIQDNGIGIGQEHLPKIFDMFYRGTQEKQGTGLGLFLVKESINKLSGKVVVCSEKGIGTTFMLEIPQL